MFIAYFFLFIYTRKARTSSVYGIDYVLAKHY